MSQGDQKDRVPWRGPARLGLARQGKGNIIMAKSPELEKQLSNLTQMMFGRERDGKACVTCGSFKILPEDFRDDLSRKEWEISFMCQTCQDGVFG